MTSPFFKPSDCDKFGSSDALIANKRDCLSLAEANRLHAEWLATGTRVHTSDIVIERDASVWQEKRYSHSRHQGTIVNIEPIEVDSERKLVEDIARGAFSTVSSKDRDELIERAKKLLEEK